MLNLLILISFIRSCIIVLFLLTALSLPAAAETLSPSEIDALTAQLVKARDVDTALNARLQCYIDKDTSFQARSIQLQQIAGDLHRQEQTSSDELKKAEFEAESFHRNFEAAWQEMDQLQYKMGNLEGQIRARQAALDDCKNSWSILNFLCDFAGEIVGLNGDLRQFSAELQAAGIKVNSLQQELNDAEIRQSQAAERFQKAQSASAQTKRDIEVAEAEIKVIKASLSEIRVVEQDYSTKLVDFQKSLKEFNSLNPGSDHRFVVRRLRDESANLDDLLVKAHVLLDENGLRLPNGERICAN